MKRLTFLRMILLVAVSIFSFGYMTAAAEAVIMEYRFTGSGVHGDVNGTGFENANFLINFFGDTNNSVPFTILDPFETPPTTVISQGYNIITGLTGTMKLVDNLLNPLYFGSFTDPLYLFVDNMNEFVGFGTSADQLSLYISGLGLGSYDLKSPFGPIFAGDHHPGTTVFNSIATPMDFGFLTVDNIADASFAAVPEPGTMLLLGSGLIGLAGFARKRLKK